MAPLDEYKRKRDFRKTPEPAGKAGVVRAARPRAGAKSRKPGQSPPRRFVIQKHDATRLHYDFRLELDGVLISWAVPKGPSLNPADKRLAVHVEDHPIEYGSFEGTIPKGQYGGGTVLLWDRGTWTPLDPDPASALKKGRLHFRLHGEKLQGEWTLSRMGARQSEGDKENWLLIKRSDEHVRKGVSIVDQRPESVESGRSIDDIAADRKAAVWKSNRAEQPRKAVRRASPLQTSPRPRRRSGSDDSVASDASIEPRSLTGAKRGSLPDDLSPQLCTLMDKPPRGEQWLHEIKFDGYRLLCRSAGKKVELITRGKQDWTLRFRPIADAIAALPHRSLILDGEAVVLDQAGRSSFQHLQKAIKLGAFDRLAFYVFDILECDGYDLRTSPLVERKGLLRHLLSTSVPLPADESATTPGASLLRYSDHVLGNGADVHEGACRLSLEGIVSKQIAATYTHGRSHSWVKVRCGLRQEFVVIGWTPPSGSRSHFGSLILGAHDATGTLIYTGRVGTGFDQRLLADIAKRLRTLKATSPTVTTGMTTAERRGVNWVRPELVAEVGFTQWTHDHRLRHPRFLGLREDKPATSVVIERSAASYPASPPTPPVSGKLTKTRSTRETRKTAAKSPIGSSRTPRSRSADAAPHVHRAITISNPDRVIEPESGLTKGDLAGYYDAIADRILPHIAGRPLSVVRCPQGTAAKCFFQKHAAPEWGEHIHAVRIKDSNGAADYLSIDSPEGLITLIQFGCIEIHPWGSEADDLERPDLLTFDLDPAPGVSLADLKAAALRVRDILHGLDLASFLKTSGGKGLHVVVPVRPAADWDEAKALAHNIALAMAVQEPDKYLAKSSKASRAGRIFVDYLRNARGATSVAPWSARARANLPVSMPISWDELATLKSPAQWTITNTPDRLDAPDPWADLRKTRQQLTTKRLNAAAELATRSPTPRSRLANGGSQGGR